MQKLSVTVLERMIKSKVSSKEVDFILYVGKYQNEYGTAEGIYYKDICDAAGLSCQGFYNCKRSLEEKGIISCTKKYYFDYDITILDNSFAGKENYGRGYISLHLGLFASEEFRELKAGAKLMAMWLLREWLIYKSKSGKLSYQMLKDTFLDKFTKLLDVTARTARAYLGMLTPFLNVYLEEGKKYYITFLSSMAGNIPGRDSENGELREHSVATACRRSRIKEATEQEKKEVCTILSQHHRDLEKAGISLSDIVARSLMIINENVRNKSRWKRYLKPSLIHKLLIGEIRACMF